MSGQTMTTVLKWALYLCGAIAVSDAYMTRIDQCEPIEIPKCRAMPYNMTQMPNLVHHNTQENARLVFEKFEVLLEQNCSDSLLFLLCSIYVPICAVSLQPEAIPPCRSVCEKAKAGCEPLMNSYNVSWPESLDCSRLPRYERGVCVSPEAFVKPVKPKKDVAPINSYESLHKDVAPINSYESLHKDVAPINSYESLHKDVAPINSYESLHKDVAPINSYESLHKDVAPINSYESLHKDVAPINSYESLHKDVAPINSYESLHKDVAPINSYESLHRDVAPINSYESLALSVCFS
ncbi:secreted frizzled-related protein 3 [Biomphalaria glabrata]|nr:secreted frizzled-related protein 3-like [Biomphalaria glabrata]